MNKTISLRDFAMMISFPSKDQVASGGVGFDSNALKKSSKLRNNNLFKNLERGFQ